MDARRRASEVNVANTGVKSSLFLASAVARKINIPMNRRLASRTHAGIRRRADLVGVALGAGIEQPGRSAFFGFSTAAAGGAELTPRGASLAEGAIGEVTGGARHRRPPPTRSSAWIPLFAFVNLRRFAHQLLLAPTFSGSNSGGRRRSAGGLIWFQPCQGEECQPTGVSSLQLFRAVMRSRGRCQLHRDASEGTATFVQRATFCTGEQHTTHVRVLIGRRPCRPARRADRRSSGRYTH